MGYRPWGHREPAMTECLSTAHMSNIGGNKIRNGSRKSPGTST